MRARQASDADLRSLWHELIEEGGDGLAVSADVLGDLQFGKPGGDDAELAFEHDHGIDTAVGQTAQPGLAKVASRENHTIFFRVVKKTPGAWKRTRTDLESGVDLDYTAVAKHDMISLDKAAHTVMVSIAASTSFADSAETTLLLAQGGRSFRSLRRWAVTSVSYYMAKHAQHARCQPSTDVRARQNADALKACIAATAWENEGYLDVTIADGGLHNEHRAALLRLQEEGIADCKIEGAQPGHELWFLRKIGAPGLRGGVLLAEVAADTALTPRPHIDIKDMTTWEMIFTLKKRGFFWKTCDVDGAAEAQPMPLSKIAPGKNTIMWFQNGSDVIERSYLKVLLWHERLRAADVKEIEHLRSCSYYARLLQQIDSGSQRSRRRPETLAFDAEGTEAKASAAFVGQPVPEPLPDRKEKKKMRRGPTNERTYAWGPHTLIFKPPHSWQASCCRRKSHVKPGEKKTYCTRTYKYEGPKWRWWGPPHTENIVEVAQHGLGLPYTERAHDGEEERIGGWLA